MPRRDAAVSRDVLDRYAERPARLVNWRSAWVDDIAARLRELNINIS